MQKIIERCGSTVILGPDESWSSVIGLQVVLDELAAGAVVVQLTDAARANSLARAQVWAKELKYDPAILDNYHVLDNYRLHNVPGRLAAKIRSAAGEVGDRQLIVFLNLASGTLPTFPETSWLPIALEIPMLVENSSVVTALSYGSPLVPPPQLRDYPADCIWSCKAAHSLQLTLTEIRPDHREIRMRGKVHNGGLIVFRPIEEPTHAA